MLLAQGLLGSCSPDVGLGFLGAEDLIVRWLPAMTVGERGQQWGFDTERRPSKPR